MLFQVTSFFIIMIIILNRKKTPVKKIINPSCNSPESLQVHFEPFYHTLVCAASDNSSASNTLEGYHTPNISPT
jgi:hypothetical protein